MLAGYDVVLISGMLYLALPRPMWAAATFLVATLAAYLVQHLLNERAAGSDFQ